MGAIPLYKDDDDFDSILETLVVTVESNGYTVKLLDEDGEETYVFIKNRDDKEMLNFIKDSLGLNV